MRRPALRSALLGAMVAALIACSTPVTEPAPNTAPSTVTTPASPATPSGAPPPTIDIHAPPGWVSLSDVDATIEQDIRYFSEHNFLGRQVNGYLEPICVLPRATAEALHRVQANALAEGYSLKVYDCYRPARAGEDFVRWAHDPTDQKTKTEFYPQVDKSQLFNLGYVGSGASSHSSGSAVDLTLVPAPPPPQRPYVAGEPLVSCTAAVGQRFPDSTIDMGTGYDCFDSLSHTLDGRITGTARDNRLRLKRLMATGAFVNYDREWWHYDLANPPYPGQYFNFPVARAALT
jgi:zinc D-Ala-D-Ala dipeptidase